jgi:hypothetical protein
MKKAPLLKNGVAKALCKGNLIVCDTYCSPHNMATPCWNLVSFQIGPKLKVRVEALLWRLRCDHPVIVSE